MSADPLNSGAANVELRARLRRIKLVAFDFDGVFTDNMVYTFGDGGEAVRCWRGDGIGLKRLRQLGLQTMIVSSETNSVVSTRAGKLGIRCFQSVSDKRSVIENIAREHNLDLSQIAYVGNDVNDLDCLQIVGLPVVVQDAQPEVIAAAVYQTKACGGNGAVREVCDLIAAAVSPGRDS
jgi:YrbI family 3-deoxy-D-manno-octulosonate 8-phosphate phosphatase